MNKSHQYLFTILFLVGAVFARASEVVTDEPINQGLVIAIQPFSGFNKDLIKLVQKNLETEFGASVKILKVRPLPKQAFYKPRSRYRAGLLLDYLDASLTGPSSMKIIGLTDKDISTTKGDVYDWGIFGYGSIGGSPCVVSTFRLRARGADEKLFRLRLVRVATHEVGHTLGLRHCPSEKCNMADAKGSILSVDRGTGELCQTCKKLIRKSN